MIVHSELRIADGVGKILSTVFHFGSTVIRINDRRVIVIRQGLRRSALVSVAIECTRIIDTLSETDGIVAAAMTTLARCFAFATSKVNLQYFYTTRQACVVEIYAQSRYVILVCASPVSMSPQICSTNDARGDVNMYTVYTCFSRHITRSARPAERRLVKASIKRSRTRPIKQSRRGGAIIFNRIHL